MTKYNPPPRPIAAPVSGAMRIDNGTSSWRVCRAELVMSIDHGTSAVMAAAAANDPHEVMRLLKLKNGPKTVDERNVHGQSAIIYAIGSRNFEVVEMLANAGADVNSRDRAGATPLEYATQQGDADVVSLLLKRGADPNIGNDNNVTPIMSAAANGNVEIIDLLLAASANCDRRDIGGMTCVHYAMRNGHLDLARRLDVEAGGRIISNMEP